MGTFICKNEKCKATSDYSLAEIHTKNSFVLCSVCKTKHHLLVEQIEGAPLRMVVGDLCAQQT
jgi:hypothetical protein